MIRTERVRSLSEFTDVCCRIRDRWTVQGVFDPWFRGQSNSEWDLKPTLYRLGLEVYEDTLRDRFQRQGAQLVSEREPNTLWEWYFLMRHHGAPTRLLDWTDSALVALFFAINSNAPDDVTVKSDAAVWMLDPWWFNKQTINCHCIPPADVEEYAHKADPYLPPIFGPRMRRRLPLAIDPPHIARRLAVQRGHFSIHGADPDGLFTVGKRKRSRLVKIILDKSAIPDVRFDLATMGIVDTTVFPDLDGLSRELIRSLNEAAVPT